jgi:molecular chaperone DnaJ
LPNKQDYYKILGVSKSAAEADIKKAYRKMAKIHHPDLNKGDKAAEAKLKEINEAYEVLSDENKRANYDQFGHAGVDPNFGPGSGSAYSGFDQEFDLGDIFGSFFGGFGGFGGGGSNSSRTRSKRGSDIQTSVSISFEESAFGCSKTIHYDRVADCGKCGGVGGTGKKACPVCRGAGQVVINQRTPFGMIQTSRPCAECGGAGKIIENPCTACGGGGRVRKSDSIEIEIPAGIDDGQILNVRNKGSVGLNGGGTGDLHINIKVRSHPIFERKNDDIWCEMPLTFTQAALGEDVIVPTLDGKVQYHVHEGAQHGDVFKLKGKGMPHIHDRGRGDQMIKINIEIPRSLSEEQKELLRQFDKISIAKNYRKKTTFFDKIKNIFGN